MPWKRTTGSDGILAATGPPRSRRKARRASRHGVARTGRALLELARSSQLRHRPTREQLWLLTHLDGWAPVTYRLDAAVNELPPGLPTDFPYGSNGLRFAHAGGEVVALPNGGGFAL